MAGRTVCDAVYGNIRLLPVENEIIDTGAFQRLRRVSHLGLVPLVFPGASFSRFAHSLGVCHVTARLVESLRRAGHNISEAEETELRVAALLHDAGHYPFSHTLEHAYKDYHAEALLAGDEPAEYHTHEALSAVLMREDRELADVLRRHELDPRRLSSIIERKDPPRLGNLVSSDLDADRIDYLMRTSHHAGLPYGAIDLDYLIDQLGEDDRGSICLSAKALRAADHFLLARVFAYQQVTFHKTVASMELLLKEAAQALVERDAIPYSDTQLERAVATGEWLHFSDDLVWGELRRLAGDPPAGLVEKLDALIRRRPPALVAESMYYKRRDHQGDFTRRVSDIRAHIPALAERTGTAEHQWIVWDSTSAWTAEAPEVLSYQREDEEEEMKAIRIRTRDGTSMPLQRCRDSLMSLLADNVWYAVRIYVVHPPAEDIDRQTLESAVAEEDDLNDIFAG